ncbi:magnesium transporter [Alysiella filiformis]|uniref:Magnesium transporter MgtE n=1 Tax=Alysiella filiformis DSM 16848 TaxID=1120981 RepID=A0A286EE19_9NEIS|nr:magnesium transporter [Alysiella filiformis]QMT30927.1 magnesium transporter [Alysiella filiformis]UBQ56086.1 magnesium transporter [Alysiella filiformis DSM 16848]SOD69150.1 magnesium transporter [Alysiella filiformis DSM 16848]
MANTNENLNVTEQLENDIADVQFLAEQLLPFRHDIQAEANHQFSLPEPRIHAQLQMLMGIIQELHPADMAAVLENLPPKERELVWLLATPEDDGDVLLEVSDTVRESLIEHMDTQELVAAVENLDVDELAELADTLPENVVAEVMKDLNEEERAQVQAAMSYQDEQVGAVMDFEIVSVRADVSCEVVLRYLRRFDSLPNHTDKIFVVDENDILQGVLPIRKLLVAAPEELVENVMAKEVVQFSPLDDVADAAAAFERYDLVTAPVVDENRKLIARLTVDEMVDVIREETEADMLNMAGLQEDEDLFAPVWDSVKNRWVWLAINLFTAFVASRVIGFFEDSISQIVALAALMPIVAGIGGNSGNQTITMIVRALANSQISKSQAIRLLKKELGVALVNGIIWGSAMGLVAWLLYGSLGIGLVMVAAMTLNLLLAAVLGVMIPVTMERFGKDPALGSSVMITAVTDSGGFLIFLGLATVFLL